MSNTVIQVEKLWKEYRLGVISHHTLTRDVQSWWARVRGQEDPNSKIDSGQLLATHHSPHPDERFWALQDVSFEVKQGDVLGIIGRNGAGKSTLLKILSQVTAPTRGEVRYKGRIASLLEVGTGFHPELTGRENIFLNGAILGMSKADVRKKLDEIVAFAEVEKFIDTPVKRYSSGMYVRLAFAVAAHLEPEILIVDEVLAVGDAQFQKKCLGKMEDVSAKEGRSVLFVSHNMAAVQKLCSRCVHLKNGVVAFVGDTDKCINMYLNEGRSASTRSAKSNFDGSLDNIQAVKLMQVCLTSLSGYENAEFDIDESIQVEIEYEVFENISNFHLYAKIYTGDGTLAFASADWDSVEGHNGKLPLGQYIARFTIPEHLLNAGYYSLSLDGLIPGIKYIFQKPNVISWEVIDKGGAGGLQSITRKGVFRPLLKWSVCKGA